MAGYTVKKEMTVEQFKEFLNQRFPEKLEFEIRAKNRQALDMFLRSLDRRTGKTKGKLLKVLRGKKMRPDDLIDIKLKYTGQVVDMKCAFRKLDRVEFDPVTIKIFIEAPCRNQTEFEKMISGIDWK
jgi:hypothetical protein